MNLVAIGDSITTRNYLSAAWPELTYSGLLAGALGGAEVSLAKGGSLIDLQAHIALTFRPAADAIMWGAVGFNDCANAGSNAARQESFGSALTAMLAWLLTPTKVLPAAMTKTGTWVKDGAGVKSTVNASTLECDVDGTAIYIIYRADYATDGGVFAVWVDSNRIGGDFYCYQNHSIAPTSPLGGTLACLRIGGLSAGSHNVLIQHTAASGKAVKIVAVTSNDGADKPTLYLGNCMPMRTGLSNGAFSSHTPTAQGQFNSVIAGVIGDFAGDGLNAVAVNLAAAFDPATQVQADLIHPDEPGNRGIAECFATPMALTLA